ASLLQPYGLSGNETFTFADIGVDSLTLVELSEEIRRVLDGGETEGIAARLDAQFLQELSIASFFTILDDLDDPRRGKTRAVRRLVRCVERDRERGERNAMRADAILELAEPVVGTTHRSPDRTILLSGATGFFGSFLLASLLEQSDATCYALVRGYDQKQA